MSQTQKSLVNQGRRLQCLIASETGARTLRYVFELVVKRGKQLCGDETDFA
jgi:hypothetical protein